MKKKKLFKIVLIVFFAVVVVLALSLLFKKDACAGFEGKEKDLCLFKEAQNLINNPKNKDGSFCENFVTAEGKSNCYLNFAIKYSDENLCLKTTIEVDKTFCNAIVSKNEMLCDGLPADKKNLCREKILAYKTGNFNYSQSVPTKRFKTKLGELIEYRGPDIENKSMYYFAVNYTDGNETYFSFVDQFLFKSLAWFENNTQKSDVIVAAPEYRYAIRGLPGNIVLNYDSEMTTELAVAFFSTDTKPLLDLMKKYNSRYVLFTADKKISNDLFNLSGIRKPVEDPVIIIALNNEDLNGFEKVFTDSFSRIYRLK